MTFDARLKSALSAIHAAPTADEARAIIDVARLAAAADKRSDIGETSMLIGLTQMLCEMAGTAVPDFTAQVDASRLLDIGTSLEPMGARELAFACAYLIVVQDLTLTDEEKQLIEALPGALVIDPERARELGGQMETMVRVAKSA